MRKVIRKRIRKKVGGIDLAAEVNAVVSSNVGEEGSVSRVSSRSRITQGAGEAGEANPPGGDDPDHRTKPKEKKS